MDKNKLEEIKQKALEDHIPIIMDDTLEVIGKELKENPPKRILEIGAAVGYSAMCFSEFSRRWYNWDYWKRWRKNKRSKSKYQKCRSRR